MTRKEAIQYAEKKIDSASYRLEMVYLNNGLRQIVSNEYEFFMQALSAIRQQEHFREVTKKVEPLTLDELSKRNDPVFVPINDFPNGGYWCLCQNGYIIPPSGYGFMAKERPNWVFYRQKPEEGTV